MARFVTAVQTSVRGWLLRRAGGVDLSKIDRVPEHLSWPLNRDGFDPVPELGKFRDEDPVALLTSFMGLNVWVVSGEEEARQVLADSTSYTNDIRPLFGKSGDTDFGGLGFTDPPEHSRLRRLLTPEFTMRRLERLRPGIEAIVERQLDEMAAGGPEADLALSFAFPVPFLVICELLGLPDEEREQFRTLASARFDVTYGGAGVVGALAGSRDYLMGFVKRQRESPGDGLVGQIIREHGDDISDFDLGGLADGAFTGGLETSASMLALGTAVLLEHPEIYRRLADDPHAVDAIVDELLRYLSVVQIAFPRFPKHDLVLAGKQIKKGDVVVCHLAGANRDPRAGFGDQPDSFDPRRVVNGSHLAFGHGFHRCVGAELAKMELRIAFPALARRFPDLSLASADLDFRAKSIVYGVDTLPVRLSPEAMSA